MRGSSWASVFTGTVESTPCRVVQHGLPSQAVFNDQIANGRQMFVRISAGTIQPYVGVARNGYTSGSWGEDTAPDKCDEIIYWDGSQAMRMQPALGLGPTPYALP